MIHDLKIRVLAHRLNLADDFIDKTFLQQFFRQIGIQYDGHRIIRLGYIAFLLCHFDEQVVFCQRDLNAINIEFQNALFIQFIHRLVAVNAAQIFLDTAKLPAVFRSNRTQLRLEAVTRKFSDVIRKFDLFYIQLVFDDLLIEIAERMLRFDEHRSDRLTVLDIRRIAGRTPHNDDLQNFFHILFQLLIDMRFVRRRKVA